MVVIVSIVSECSHEKSHKKGQIIFLNHGKINVLVLNCFTVKNVRIFSQGRQNGYYTVIYNLKVNSKTFCQNSGGVQAGLILHY